MIVDNEDDWTEADERWCEAEMARAEKIERMCHAEMLMVTVAPEQITGPF